MASESKAPAGTLERIATVTGPFDGLSLLDIGCGGGSLARALAKRGAKVSAIDPAAAAVVRAKAAAPEAEVLQAGAEALPFPAERFDAAIMMNSLHHVPEPLMEEALDEALRVLKPGRPLIVIEPLAEGSNFQAMRILEDETEIRAKALAALAQIAATRGLTPLTDETFDRVEVLDSKEHFFEKLVAVGEARAKRLPQVAADLEAAFLRHAEAVDGGYRLVQPLRLQAFAKPR